MLDQNGQVRLVQPHQISMRRDSNRAIASDSEGHELRINDNVKEIDGEVSTPSLCMLPPNHGMLRDEKDEFSIPTNLSLHFCTTGTL